MTVDRSNKTPATARIGSIGHGSFVILWSDFPVGPGCPDGYSGAFKTELAAETYAKMITALYKYPLVIVHIATVNPD